VSDTKVFLPRLAKYAALVAAVVFETATALLLLNAFIWEDIPEVAAGSFVLAICSQLAALAFLGIALLMPRAIQRFLKTKRLA
jgi:hypothetical protein